MSTTRNPLATTDRGCKLCQSTRPCGVMDPSLLEPPPADLFDDDDDDDDNDDDNEQEEAACCGDMKKNGKKKNGKKKSSSSCGDVKWQERYKQLVQYYRKHGHAAVPTRYRAHPALGLWVKRQRHLYAAGRLSAGRMAALHQVDFLWHARDAHWHERLGELQTFQQTYGHVNVPTVHAENPALASWVRCQRHQQQLRATNRPSTMNAARYAKLQALGFSWRVLGTTKNTSTSSRSRRTTRKKAED